MKRHDKDTHETDVAALAFFKTFSRFEFAMKETRYLKCVNNSRNASPDWDLFVKENKNRYQPSKTAQDSIKALLNAPPNKQKVIEDSNGKLVTFWEPMKFDDNTPILKILVDIVLCIRNNLFHGGKYRHDSWDNCARVLVLLNNSIVIIKDWLTVDDDLNAFFNDFA